MENGAHLHLEEVSKVLSGRDPPLPGHGVWWPPPDGLSTAVSFWKCPPAWSPLGIPKSRCPVMAEHCSTFCNQTGWSQRFLILIRYFRYHLPSCFGGGWTP